MKQGALAFAPAAGAKLIVLKAYQTDIFCLVLFRPIVFVDVKNIKVRHPKATFVEPSQLKIAIFWLVGMLVAAFFAMIVLVFVQLSNMTILINTDVIVGSMVMMFLIMSVLFSPATAYMLNAKLRYKRIIKYKTAEWMRLQK